MRGFLGARVAIAAVRQSKHAVMLLSKGWTSALCADDDVPGAEVGRARRKPDSQQNKASMMEDHRTCNKGKVVRRMISISRSQAGILTYTHKRINVA